jgi:hypothetical protein
MSDHERDCFVVGERAPLRVQLSVESLFRAQKFARRDAQPADEFAQFRFAGRRGEVVVCSNSTPLSRSRRAASRHVLQVGFS